MPKQSRGFWCCTFCEQAFDQYGEAEYHERHECTAVARPEYHHLPPFSVPPLSSNSMVSSTAVDPIPSVPWHHSQSQPPPIAVPFPPVDQPYYQNTRYTKPYPDSDPYGRGMVPISESDTGHGAAPPPQSGPSRQMMLPYESKLAVPSRPPPSYTQQQPPQLRYLPILGSSETSTLTSTDELACRSLEFFEVLAPDLFDENEEDETNTGNTSTKPSATTSLTRRRLTQQHQPMLQVGIRCAFCAESETTTESYIFPANTRSIGDSIRHAGFDHLIRCLHYPDDYKRQIQDVLWKRNDRAASGQPESDEEESLRRRLIEFCTRKCEQVGVVDRHPIGMIFANSAGGSHGPESSSSSSAAMQQQHYNERAFGGRSRSSTGMLQSQQGLGETREEESSATNDANLQPQHYPQHHHMPPHFHGAQSMIQLPPPPMMTHEFPYYFDQNRWVCKYCAHLPPSYRDAQSYWIENTPPPPNFMDYHLGICREYQRSMMYEQSMQATVYGGRDPAQAAARQQQPMLSPSFGAGQIPPGWEQHPQSRAIGPSPPRPGMEYGGSQDVLDSPYSTPQFHRQLPRTGRGEQVRAHQMQHRDPMSTSSNAAMIRTPVHRDPPPPHRSSSVDEVALVRAIEHLEALDESHYTVAGGNILREDDRLVVEEDRLLLTDYFYYLMKQLRPVRFSEADRRTRGGKREKVKVGYGGLQCIHCIDVPNSRKFFWSNVDRLANSFAEIPTHVLKCRRCPQSTKDALVVLKNRHAEQMSRLSRGSQKVFFRRMWRRLHQDDPAGTNDEGVTATSEDFMSPMSFGVHPGDAKQSTLESMRPAPLHTKSSASAQLTGQNETSDDVSPSGTSGSEESAYFLQRPAKEAAKALVDASMQSGPPTPSSRVLLAIPEDREWLSDTDCFVRRQLEVFCATAQDVEAAVEDRKYPIKEGQVGIRCIHCAMTKNGYGARGPAVAYPFSISGLFESAREIERTHLGSRENVGSRDSLMITCENLPLSAKEKLESLKGAASSLSSVLRKYFILGAKALGLRDTVSGIRAGADPILLGTQAPLVFTDSSESIEEIPATSEMEKIDPNETIAMSRSSVKRKADDSSLPPLEQTVQKQRRTVVLLKDDNDDNDREGEGKVTALYPPGRSTDVGHGISMLAGAAATDRATTSRTTEDDTITESNRSKTHAEV